MLLYLVCVYSLLHVRLSLSLRIHGAKKNKIQASWSFIFVRVSLFLTYNGMSEGVSSVLSL